jgi:hypothetical protein
MKKILLFVLLLTFSITQNFSQKNKDTTNFWDNVQFGGGLTLGFSNNVTNIGISPSAIYNFDEKFSAGLGASYLYSKAKDIDDALNVYGGSLITLYNPTREIQLSAEFEETILTRSGFSSANNEALYIGAGYTVGRNVAIGVRYDLLYDDNTSFYASAFSPIVRVYF